MVLTLDVAAMKLNMVSFVVSVTDILFQGSVMIVTLVSIVLHVPYGTNARCIMDNSGTELIRPPPPPHPPTRKGRFTLSGNATSYLINWGCNPFLERITFITALL